MKFYIDKKNIISYKKIIANNLTAIYKSYDTIIFFKNGKFHSSKNAAVTYNSGFKLFYLNSKFYGNNSNIVNYSKSSWRRFTKLQVFL